MKNIVINETSIDFFLSISYRLYDTSREKVGFLLPFRIFLQNYGGHINGSTTPRRY